MSKNHKYRYSPRDIRVDIKTLHRRVQENEYLNRHRFEVFIHHYMEKLRHDKEKLIRKRYKEMPKHDTGENDDF